MNGCGRHGPSPQEPLGDVVTSTELEWPKEWNRADEGLPIAVWILLLGIALALGTLLANRTRHLRRAADDRRRIAEHPVTLARASLLDLRSAPNTPGATVQVAAAIERALRALPPRSPSTRTSARAGTDLAAAIEVSPAERVRCEELARWAEHARYDAASTEHGDTSCTSRIDTALALLESRRPEAEGRP